MGLPYKIEIVQISEAEGGGYLARLPQFGILGIVGDGDTKENALADLEQNQKERFQQYLVEGLEIPEPEIENEDYSGRFVLRIPRYLHRELAQNAQKNGVSLNHYVCTLLTMNFQTDRFNSSLNEIHNEIQLLSQLGGVLSYNSSQIQQTGKHFDKTLRADEYPEAA